MKFSDIKGERVLDVISEIIEPLANIAQDENTQEIFKSKKCPEGVTPRDFMISRIKSHAPALISGHKDDIVSVLATINDVDKEEYASNMTMASLIRDVFELLTDEEFLDFLAPSQTKKQDTQSGDASETTEDQKLVELSSHTS